MATYKLDYTIWNTRTEIEQRIKGDVVRFDEPKNYADILVGLWERWVAIRGDYILVGDCEIELLSH